MKLRLLLAGSILFVFAPAAALSIESRGGHGGFAGGSGRGGAGGGERRGPGGGEAMHRTPSLSGGAGPTRTSSNRPSGAGMVPRGGSGEAFGNRRSQPEGGNRFASRPNFDRPGEGFQNRMGAGERRPGGEGRPSWNGGETRPNLPNRPGEGGSGERWPGGVARPNFPERPGQGESGERWPVGDGRPNGPTRPGQGGSGERWPNGDRRPNWPDGGRRPNGPGQGGIGDRTNIIGDRTNIGNRTNINSGNQSVNINNNNIVNNRTWNNQNNWQHNWNGAHNGWNQRYDAWHHGNWNNWYRPPAAWYGAGVATGWLASPGDTYVYSNPFYAAPATVAYNTAPTDVSYNYLDYSQSIPQPPLQPTMAYGDSSYAAGYDAPTGDAYGPVSDAGPPVAAAAIGSTEPAPADEGPPPEAFQRFDSARAAFKAGDYSQALTEIDAAIKLLPSDVTRHEFRALVLFAQRKYRDAAAGVYAVLSAGPGWSWETMRDLYSDADTYTKQLRALEDYSRNHPDASDAHFLLAYHYLVLNHVPAAVKQLEHFVKLVPQDKLAPQLIAAFTPPAGTTASTGPAAPAQK